MNRSEVKLSVDPISRLLYKGQPNYTATDDNEEPQCGDPDCNCRPSITGLGETAELAEADFWEQWEEREMEKEDHRMRQLDAEAEKGIEP